ncbi:MAG TPA: lamin tail domain-containing protein [Candidatus Bathyarchaeia archaeon]|nr:lamin tail domain-containing protein [Candidatus Bathyarchaeia archaeon]
MRGIRVVLSFVLAVSQVSLFMPPASALSSSGVVIAQMYPGANGVATQEFVEIYNNSSSVVDVTGWCLYYISSSGQTTTKLSCLKAPDALTKLLLKAGGYATFVSNEYKTATGASGDAYFAGAIAATAGHVKILDSNGTEMDRLGWGSAIGPEAAAAAAPANGKSLQRKAAASGLQDTDSNANDFAVATPLLHASDVYEVVTFVDVCPNIAGAQAVMPAGYLADEAGNCQADSCLNLPGLQVSVPDGYDSNAVGSCTRQPCRRANGDSRPYGPR